MNIIFYAAEKEKEQKLAHAFRVGAESAGHTCTIVRNKSYTVPLPEYDVACIFGVKGPSYQFLLDHQAAGKKTLFFDKGYLQRGRHYRVAVNGFHPTSYLYNIKVSDTRFRKIGIRLSERRTPRDTGTVLYAGSSQKYATFNRLGNANNYAVQVINEIKKYSNRPVVYRPKPSWGEAKAIPDTTFSGPEVHFKTEVSKAYCVVTHGSNAAVEAMVHGVPSIVLADHPASLFSTRNISEINDLKFPDIEERTKFMHHLCYCQWTIEEYRSGEAWEHLQKVLEYA